MKDQEKAKAELLRELETLRGKVAGFEKTEVEHKRAEEAHRKSQERFRKIFQYSNDAIFIFDPERDIIVDTNPKSSVSSLKAASSFEISFSIKEHHSWKETLST